MALMTWFHRSKGAVLELHALLSLAAGVCLCDRVASATSGDVYGFAWAFWCAEG